MRKLLLLLSCALMSISYSKDESSKLSQSSLTLYSGDTATLTYSGSCKWRSDQPLIASVDNGVVKALLIGKTNIYANNEVCQVTVKPHYTQYAEPYIKWGTSTSAYESYMSGYGYTKVSGDNSGGLWIDDITNTMYMYIASNGQISATCIITSLHKTESLTKFLCERFIPLDYVDGSAYFVNIAYDTMIGETINTDYKDEYALWALAIPYDTRANEEEVLAKFKQIYESYMQ